MLLSCDIQLASSLTLINIVARPQVEGTEEVGSWKALPCASSRATTVLKPVSVGVVSALSGGAHAQTALVTPSGAHLVWNNAFGASGPVPHARYLSTDSTASNSSTWLKIPSPEADSTTFSLMASDRTGVIDDDKVGSVTAGGDFCLDLVQDADKEVWAGPLADKKWAVALLNRDPLANATITVAWTMFNSTADATYGVKDVWLGTDIGEHKGFFTASVAPQAVTYIILTPSA